MDQPLLVTSDTALAEEVARLAAAAGASVLRAVSSAAALSRWASAPLVLVGADAAAELVELAPARRPLVSVVGWSLPPPGAFRDALLLGAEAVLELPAASELLVESLADLGSVAALAPLVGVLAGSGGVGATTLSCALAQVCPDPSLVVDLDPLGPGCDRVLGLDELPGVRWDALGRASGRLSGRSLHDAVPRRDGVGVLTWPPGPPVDPDPRAVREALSAARRGHDLVVADLPRSLTPLVLETAARCSRVAVLVEASVTGLASAARLLAALPDRDALPLGVVVRGPDSADADRLAGVLGLPLLATLPDQRGLAESLDLGLGPVRRTRGPLARAARSVLASLAPATGSLALRGAA